jgi:hypothetical protein
MEPEEGVGQLLLGHADGSCSIMLRPCPTATVAELLDPSVPFVWVVGHSPYRVLQWWELDIPIARGERPRRLRVRSLWCELLLDMPAFAEVAGQFDGGTVYQMARPAPDSLAMQRLPEDRLYATRHGSSSSQKCVLKRSAVALCRSMWPDSHPVAPRRQTSYGGSSKACFKTMSSRRCIPLSIPRG